MTTHLKVNVSDDACYAVVNFDNATGFSVFPNDIPASLRDAFVVAGIVKKFAEFKAGKKDWSDKEIADGYLELVEGWKDGAWSVGRSSSGESAKEVLRVALEQYAEELGKAFTDEHWAKYSERVESDDDDKTPPYTDAVKTARSKARAHPVIAEYMKAEQEKRSRKTTSIKAATDEELF